MSEFEKFIEDNFKELKSRIESGNFFAMTMKDSMHATWLKQQSEIDQLKAEKAGLEKQLKYQEAAYKNVKLQFLNKEMDCSALEKRTADALHLAENFQLGNEIAVGRRSCGLDLIMKALRGANDHRD